MPISAVRATFPLPRAAPATLRLRPDALADKHRFRTVLQICPKQHHASQISNGWEDRTEWRDPPRPGEPPLLVLPSEAVLARCLQEDSIPPKLLLNYS